MTFYDVTLPVHSDMVVYPGNPAVQVERVMSLEAGGACNLSRLDLGSHTGTHVDAPVHFLSDGPGVDETPLEVLMGPATVVDATGIAGQLDAPALQELVIPATGRVLLKTRNSALWDRGGFEPGYAGLTPDAAAFLVGRAVRLVGLDYLSIGSGPSNPETHRTLLGAGVVIVEGLDLRDVPPGDYELICLPLRLAGGDGSPARVVLRGPG